MAEPLALPEIRCEGEDITFTWRDQAIEVAVRDVTIGRDGPRGEVWARHLIVGHLHTSMVNLLSTTSKGNFVKALLARDGATNWVDVVEQFTVLAVEAYRKGEPLETLEARRRPEAGQFAVNPLAPLGQISLWFGDGKSLKSYTLEAACRAMALGQPLANMQTTPMTPAFLDWEWEKQEHEDRLLRLGGEATILYRRCTAPLHEQARALKRELDRAGVDFLGIDSMGMACGGDPSSPEVALRFFGAIRYLGRTAVVIHHVPKGGRDPFGSAFIRNSSRAGWSFTRSMMPDESAATVALAHEWTNTGRRLRPIGLTFTFDEDAYSTTITRADADAEPILQLTGGLSKKEGILAYLETCPGAELQEIALAIGEDTSKVSVHLSQLKKRGRVANHERKWALASGREPKGT